jgi:hypothetical protein
VNVYFVSKAHALNIIMFIIIMLFIGRLLTVQLPFEYIVACCQFWHAREIIRKERAEHCLEATLLTSGMK